MEPTRESPIHRLEVLAARLIPLEPGQGRGVQILVFAEGLHARAAPLVARVGEQAVETIHQSPGGFSGVLARPPRAGDRLEVGYLDTGPQPTEVVFGPSDVA